MGKIALEFDELDPEQAKRLIAAYEQIVGRPMEDFARTAAGIMEVQHQQQATTPAPQPQHQQPAPPPAPQPQHQQPAPQPQPAVPAQPQAQPSGGQVASGALDAFGVPYNPQLHSVTDGPSGGRNKDGSWKMKKNTDKAAYKDWADRHKRAPGAPSPQPQHQQPAPASPAPAPSAAGAPPFPGTAPAGGVPAFPGLNPGSGWPQPAQPQPPIQEVSFPLFCAKVNDLSRKGLLTAQISARIMETVGCTDVDKLNRDPHFRTLAYAELMKIDATEVAPAQV